MSFFTWKDKGLTSDCSSLEAMASRFEETANLMRKLSKKGFQLKKTQKNIINLLSENELSARFTFKNHADIQTIKAKITRLMSYPFFSK